MSESKYLTASIRRQFAGFPLEYSLAPLWSWNDYMREDEIVRQLDEMQAQHVNEAMIFPMVGLTQRYLSPEYFDAYRFTLKAARKRGMRIWVYDDYCWPSGTAAGQLLEQYPEYRMPVCRFYRYQIQTRSPRHFRVVLPPGRVLYAWAEKSGSPGKYRSVMDAVLDSVLDWRAPTGVWTINLVVVTQVQITLEAATGSRWSRHPFGYLDVLNPAAVQKFIEMVYEAHYNAAPEFFGSTMPGFFTDEPGFLYDMQIEGGRDKVRPGYHSRPGALDTSAFADNPVLHGYHRSIPWTHDLVAQFHDRYGYDLRPRLPELIAAPRAAGSVGYDFFKLASDLFAANYAGQIGEWCGRHKVAFSGHWTEGFGLGDLFAKASHQHVPGIDILGAHSVFSKLIMLPRQIASIARMTGRNRVISETYGVTPWSFELADKIRDADLLTVLGINLHAPIDYAYSFRGIRKHTNNPPGFYHAPAWRYQKYFSDHTARLCQATNLGQSAVATAVLYPSHADIANTITDPSANDRLNQNLRMVFTTLIAAQIESDFLFESGIDRARIKNDKMIFPGAEYRTVIIAGVDVLARETFVALADFVKAGGRVILFDCQPGNDPQGRPAPSTWQALMKRAIKPDRDGSVPAPTGICAGQIITASDPLGMVTHSAVLANGDKELLFDGTDSLAVFEAKYPQEITVDLGAMLSLTELSFVVEEIKKDIIYDYTWQVSGDGRKWCDVATLSQSGREHVLRLDDFGAAASNISNFKSQISNGAGTPSSRSGMISNGAGTPSSRSDMPGDDKLQQVKACLIDEKKACVRYVRLLVKQGGGRFLGLHSLAIKHLDEHTKAEKTWKTPVSSQAFWRKLAGCNNVAPLKFIDENGNLCGCLATTTRMVGRDRVMAVMNRSDQTLKLIARITDAGAGYSVESWDLDTGTIQSIEQEPSSISLELGRPHPAFDLDFAPYECRVLTVIAKPERLKAAPAILTRRFETITETGGPWPFTSERQNAFPLLAGSVRFADPANPGKWLSAENGGLPKPLRFVPRVMFECSFDIKTLPHGNVELLFEEDMLTEISVNGKQVKAYPERNRYLDAFGLSLPVDGCLRKGKNLITSLFMPEIYERTMGGVFYHADVIQPTLDAFLLGDFSVANDHIVKPVRQLDGKSWQEQGYPYYSGTGVYTVRLKLPKERSAGALFLEVSARNGVVELCDIHGKPQAVRIATPYLFDVSKHAQDGLLEILLKVTSTIGSLLTHQRMGALTGNYIKQYASGLESVRLVRQTLKG